MTLEKVIWYVLALFALGFAIAAFVVRPESVTTRPASSPTQQVQIAPEEKGPDYEKRMENVRHELSEQTIAFRNRNRMILNDFLNGVGSAGSNEYNLARQGVDPFVNECTGVKFYFNMCVNLAKDWKNKTDTATNDMKEKLNRHVIAHMKESDAEVSDAYQNFIARMQESDNQYRAAIADLREINSDLEGLPCFKQLFDGGNEIVDRIHSNVSEAAFTAIGVAFEAICIRTTVKCVIHLCSGVARGIARKSAISTILAMIDGPLPFGDILAAAGLAWCVKDVYDIAVKCPRELRVLVNNTIEEHREQMLNDVVHKARGVVAECERQSEEIQQQLFQ